MHFKNFGFTLAEVLITLGIIGVISAMTIPSLMATVNRVKWESMLKEDYSIILQALKLAESQDVTLDSIPDNLQGMTYWFETYLGPNLRTTSVCYDKAGCWAKGHSYNLRGGLASSSREGIGIGGGIITFKLANGTNMCIDGWDKGSIKNLFGVEPDGDSFSFYIDVNGDSLPNTIGKDIYILVWKNGTLVPAGTDVDMTDVNINCSVAGSATNAGYYCLRKVIANGWKIPD